jgi:hypothetical protein
MITSAQAGLDKQIRSKDTWVKTAEEFFEKDRKVIDGYINTHSQESMQQQAVIYEFNDFCFRKEFEDPSDKNSRRLIYIDQNYFDKQLPSYVPQLFTLMWRWNDNAPGLYFKKQLEENFPIEKLRTMLPGARTQKSIEDQIKIILAGFTGMPNNDSTWLDVKKKISDYLMIKWQEGTLFGSTTNEAFYIKADRTTMTQTDINSGKLIIEVGLALIKPVEFVINRYEQKLHIK